MLTVFWNMKRLITIDFLKKGANVNNGSSCKLFSMVERFKTPVTITVLPTFFRENSPYLLNDICVWWVYNVLGARIYIGQIKNVF